jgi:sugar lactone lactonase YvrE
MQTIAPKLDLVVDANNHLGETPLWLAQEQVLFWVNCEEPPELHRWNPANGEHRVWPMPRRIGGVAAKASGGLIVALADGLYDFDPADGSLRLRVKSQLAPEHAMHETCVDRQGRLWVGGYALNMQKPQESPKAAALFRLTGDRLVRMVDGITVSNGLAFSPDGRTLYHTDCMTGILKRWDLDPVTGDITNPRDFFSLPLDQGIIDGGTVDRDGGYWSALIGASKLRRYLPDGTLDLEVRLPVERPTMVTFGGPDLDTLFITTANLQHGKGPRDAAKSGGLFSFKPGFKGLPASLVK